MLQVELTNKGPYRARMSGMYLQLQELQEFDSKAQQIRVKELPEDWKDLEGVLHYQGFSYILKIVRIELISRYHNNSLTENFGVEKTRKLIGWKYYWPSLRRNIKTYVKGYDMCLVLKPVRHKPYKDLQSMPILTYQ